MEYTVNISRFEKNKTQAQLGYYWGVIIPELMRFQGCSAIEADHVLKTELVPPRITMIMEVVIHIRASIAKMKIKEMAEYIDNCVHFLGTWGVVVPPPPYKGEDYDKKNTSNKRKSV
ncbi:MAG: hypothetical protein GY820_38315 [Gammaproteobacteria bacterium]|nr:hypothetical protein [Gammaproteobacteria bacterium]